MKLKRHKDFLKESNESSVSSIETPWIYNGDFKVTKKMVSNGEMIKEKIPDVVNGQFNCSSIELTTLKNCPEKVTGEFNCSVNKLTSLKGFPKKIGGSLVCGDNKLKNLKFGPKEINGNFYCDDNELTSLEFGPKKVSGYYSVANNKLTSLKGCPEEFKSNFYCDNNLLTSLEFGPKKVSFMSTDPYLKIEAKFIEQGYKDYWPDLLQFCIDNNHDLELIKSWPEGFLTDEIKKSSKGISKFDL